MACNSVDRLRPLVGIATSYKSHGLLPFYKVISHYVDALSQIAQVTPVLIPALDQTLDLRNLLTRLDGLLLPGSSSNIEPHHYNGSPSIAGTLHDPKRDAMTLPLIREAVSQDLPLLCICRGMQELNVALGGTLYQRLHEIPGHFDHRCDEQQPVEVQYHPIHRVDLCADGMLRSLAGVDQMMVNSLHEQGIDRLAERLVVEAVAPDGVIEAVRVADHSFAIGIQWHPEWQFEKYSFNCQLFDSFGQAVLAYTLDRTRITQRVTHRSKDISVLEASKPISKAV